MLIPENSPIQEIQVRGVKIHIPVVFSDQDLNASAETLSDIGVSAKVAAEILQQSVCESIAEKISPFIKSRIKNLLKTLNMEWDGKVRSLSEEQRDYISENLDTGEIQKFADVLIKNFTPGTKRIATNLAEAIDPVDAKAFAIAKAAIITHLETLSFTFDGITYPGVGKSARSLSNKMFNEYCLDKYGMPSSDLIEEKANELVANDNFFRKEAERQLAATAKAVAHLSVEA